MSHRNHDKPALPATEVRARKVKLIEGSIVFVLALTLCVYLGIRFADDPADTADSVAVEVIDLEEPVTLETVDEPLGAEPTAAAAPDGTDPAPAVESEVSATGPGDHELNDVLPNVPLVVTYSLAEETYHEGRYGVAAGMFATYCDEHPENAWGHYMHGLSLWKAGELEAAGDALDEALRLKPDHFKSLVNRARVELDLDRPEVALASIEQALDLAPDNLPARRVLGRVYHDLERQDEAVATYLDILRQDTDDAWTLNNLALVWIEQEQFERAVAPLARAVELSPEVAVIRNNLGTVLERTGHAAQARDQFEVACRLGSARGEASFARLDAVTMPADAPIVDLVAVAAAWTVPTDTDGTATPAVAALTLEEADNEIER